MSEFLTTLNFDTDFHVPKDCLKEGDVHCRVLFAECHVVDRWDEMLTFKVRLVLRISIRSGGLRCSFDREIVLRETVWFDGCLDLLECKVKSAVCKCVVHHGRVLCNGTVSIHFMFRHHHPVCPCPPCPCDCGGCHHSGGCHRCDESDDFSPCDTHCDWQSKRGQSCRFACKPVRVCRH